MYAGQMYAGLAYAGEMFQRLRRRRAGFGIGGSGFPEVYGLLNTEEDRKRRSREHLLAIREDEDSVMGVT
jgi:hypothetical protein